MTRRRVPTPPASLGPVNVESLPAGTSLHRLHDSAFRGAEFNPGKGRPTRFAPFADPSTGASVPTLYAATTREAAAFESIFHDIKADAPFKSVPLRAVENKTASVLRTRRPIVLARLFAPDLSAMGLRKDQLIDTPKSDYAATVLWAQALHRAREDLDGLMWTSRACDPDRCILAFGDRLRESDVEVLESRPVHADPALLAMLRDFGRRAGIVIVT